jgi:hypothetical protein
MLSRVKLGRGTAIASVLFAGVVLLAGASAAPAQSAPTDARWQAWLGCWEPAGAMPLPGEGSRDRMVCILPAAGASAVNMATIDSGHIVAREYIDAVGKRLPSSEGGCTGWQSAEWSQEGQRVFLKSEYDCGNGLKRVSSGILAMAPGGVWLDARSGYAQQGSGVRVFRYREAPIPPELEGELSAAVGDRALAVSTARTVAAAPLTTEDVVEASHKVDAPVVEAWLIERHQNFGVDAKQLSALADAGVPDRVIDAMVALSYPKAFAIGPSRDIDIDAQPESLSATAYDATRATHSLILRPYGYYSPFDYYSPFSYSGYGYGYSPYGLGYGYGWYPGGSPVIIIKDPNGAQQRSHGKVVNGQGYIRGDGGSGDNRRTRTTRRAPEASNSGSTTAAPAPRSNPTGNATGRTAKPRPEP